MTLTKAFKYTSFLVEVINSLTVHNKHSRPRQVTDFLDPPPPSESIECVDT